jgi:hypothetical protein
MSDTHLRGLMLDRFDPLDDSRSKDTASERHRGPRGGGDRNEVRGDEDRDSFGRQVDLQPGRERELVRHRGSSYPLNGPEAEAVCA